MHTRLGTAIAGQTSSSDVRPRCGGTKPVALLDANYKRKSPQAGTSQALSYAKAFGFNRVALVYPADDEVEVLVRTVPVGHRERSIDDLDDRAATAMHSVIKELLPPARLASAA